MYLVNFQPNSKFHLPPPKLSGSASEDEYLFRKDKKIMGSFTTLAQRKMGLEKKVENRRYRRNNTQKKKKKKQRRRNAKVK